MADGKPTFDFGGAFSAAGDKLADYAGKIPAPIDSVGLSSMGDSIANSPGAQAVSGGLDFGDAFSSAGKRIKRGLMSAQDSVGSAMQSASQPVQDLLDTVRVFYNQIPDEWKKYVTTVYPEADQRMKNVEQKVTQYYHQFVGAAQQTQAGQDNPDGTANIGAPGPSPQAAGPQPHSTFPPPGISAPIAEPRIGMKAQMDAVAASKRGQVKNPLSNHPLASDPSHKVPESKGTPVSANRLADNATLGDAVAFFMANDNLSRKDAFDAAQKVMAKREADRLASAQTEDLVD